MLQVLSGDLAILESRVLLCFVLKCTRADLIVDPNRTLSPEQEKHYRDLIQLRLQGQPIAKIIGEKEFWGLPFKVTKDTLDPRPDTEILIETVLESVDKSKSNRILDLGTGTGCVLLSLLHELKKSFGVGVDLSQEALNVAEENACNLCLNDRAVFLQSNWGEKLEGKFDIIVSNPPYITQADYDVLSAQVRDYDPKLALVGGEDGLECYKKIAPIIDKHLEPNGFFAIEFGINQESMVSQILNENNLHVLEIRKDLAGILRCIKGRHGD